MSFILSIKVNNLIQKVNLLAIQNATNTANIATNTANIATNTANIATNTTNIATNTTNIATNTTNIATNTTNTATNTDAIASLGIGRIGLTQLPSYITTNLYDLVYNTYAGYKTPTLYYRTLVSKTYYLWSNSDNNGIQWYKPDGVAISIGSPTPFSYNVLGILSYFNTTPTQSTGDLTFSDVNGQKNGIKFPSNGLYNINWITNGFVSNTSAFTSPSAYITKNYTFQGNDLDYNTLKSSNKVMGISSVTIDGAKQGETSISISAVVNITDYQNDFICLSLINRRFASGPVLFVTLYENNFLSISRL
jgi:hypothetical protein